MRFTDAMDHLTAELRRLDLLLRRQVLRLRAAHVPTEDEFRGLYVSDAQVDAMLRQGLLSGIPGPDNDAPDIAGINQQLIVLEAAIAVSVEQSGAAGIILPLADLSSLLGLSSFERSLLILAVAPELDQRYEVLFSYAQNDVTRKRPSIGLALALFADGFRDGIDHGAAFRPNAPLLHRGLIRLADDGQDRDSVYLSRQIRADYRVAQFLLGGQDIEERLVAFTHHAGMDPHQPPPDLVLTESRQLEFQRVAAALQRRPGVVLIEGASGAGKLTAARVMCREMKLPLLCADLAFCPGKLERISEYIGLLSREALLTGAAIHLRHFEALINPDSRDLAERSVATLARCGAPVFLGSQAPWQPGVACEVERFFHITLPMPTLTQRISLWERAISWNGHACTGGDGIALLANKFALTPGQIQAAARQARQMAGLRGAADGEVSDDELHLAARRQSNQELRRLAQKIMVIQTWENLVLPEHTLQQLRAICVHVQYRHIVYGEWGFDRRLSLGKGVKAMFSGPSGVGKTMAAEVLAHELGVDLYKIDLSMVVSKYIGETEKNLNAIFREAQTSNAMLFFDEADALFGKRSEVKDAHDRYANIEISYLLQKMEEYDGIVILATNLANNVDEAFARRLHHTVEFPLPDAACREKIWRGMFTPEMPLDSSVDLGFMARQFEFAGGNIRNVAVSAAFMAAQNGGCIKMEHLIQATARELNKMGRLPLKTSFREYFELIRSPG